MVFSEGNGREVSRVEVNEDDPMAISKRRREKVAESEVESTDFGKKLLDIGFFRDKRFASVVFAVPV